MPFRTMTTLQAWVDDFRALGYDDASILRVIPQDSEDGADAGLIAAQLKSVSTTFFVAPGRSRLDRMGVTFEPREDAAPLPAGRVMACPANWRRSRPSARSCRLVRKRSSRTSERSHAATDPAEDLSRRRAP